LLLSYLAACYTTWQVQGVSPQIAAVAEEHDALWVARTDSAAVILEQPRVTGDTLRGFVNGTEVSIPVVDIAQVGVKRVDGRMAVLIPVMVLTIVSMAAVLGGEGVFGWGKD
jgi:hypothetical protein